MVERGCKCLEIDVWDDTNMNNVRMPVVYHGYTLTTKIPFADIIVCVRDYVVSNHTLPIILSLENHCTPPFQRIMAQILSSTLKDLIYTPKNSESLPTPLDLVGKVIIKGKRPPEKEGNAPLSSDPMNYDLLNIDESEELKDEEANAVGSLILPKIVPELSKLTMFNGAPFNDFRSSMSLPPTHMHSFSETKVQRMKSPISASLWRQYNKDHMTRTYPSGSRVDSSNYKPLVPWAMGCQLVALNFQSDDCAMSLNDGRFHENGGCGYVRKPISILQTGDEHATKNEILLKIRVLSGCCLPKPHGEKAGEVIDPYVIVRVHDVLEAAGSDSITSSLRKDFLETSERKTKPIRDNGFCPQWKSEVFCFPIHSPDIAMVEFVVMDNDAGFLDDKMCKTSVPVSCLRKGFRSVQFAGQCGKRHGAFDFASILVDVDIEKLPHVPLKINIP